MNDLIHNPASNGGPPLDPAESALALIDSLYEEAKHWADGEPITSTEIAEAVTKLHDSLHEAGKVADELRIAEKKPFDDKVDAIQTRFNPYVQPKKGRVALGKAALGELLTAWRVKVAAEAAAVAEARRKEADKFAAAAQSAMRASAGNLAERERAEVLLVEAKDANKWAGRAEKKATVGTGLRTVWTAEMVDAESALEWAYTTHPYQFTELVQSLADTAVRNGARSVPGFVVKENKVAT